MKLLSTVLVALTLFFIGCGKKAAEKMMEAAAEKEGVKAKVNLDDQTITIETEEGVSKFVGGKSVKIPDNFPKDVYVYEHAALISSITVPNGINLNLQTKDAADKVVEKIKSKMGAEGWKQEATFTQGEQFVLAYKKEKRSANIVVNGGGDQTQIVLAVTSEKDEEDAEND